MNGGPVARVRAWLERAAADGVSASVVDDLVARLGSMDVRTTHRGAHVGFWPTKVGERRRVLELDRHGTLLTVLRHGPDGELVRAWIRAADRTWVAIETRATEDAPWGLSDRLWQSPRLVADHELPGRPLTVFQAVSWAHVTTIPVLAEPVRLPSGTGTAVLNLLASLAQDQGRAWLRYAGAYPTEQLFLALLESFRYAAAAGDDPLDTFMREGLAWAPWPFDRVFLDSGVCLQRRDRIEKVTWRGVTYYRPDWQGVLRHVARRIEDVPGGVRCVLHALDRTLEEHLVIEDAGRVEVRARPAEGACTGMPASVATAIVALVATASAEPLVPFILRAGASVDFEWGPVTADLVARTDRSVRVSSILMSAVSDALRRAPSRDARHRAALAALEEIAQLVGDSLRVQAQAGLLALESAAQEAALVAPSRDEATRRQAEIARKVAAGVEALAAASAGGEVRPSGR